MPEKLKAIETAIATMAAKPRNGFERPEGHRRRKSKRFTGPPIIG
jgi:hypothetical protein